MPKQRGKLVRTYLTDRSVALFKDIIRLEAAGMDPDSRQRLDLSMELHRELGLQPWDFFVDEVPIDGIADPSWEPRKRASYTKAVTIRRHLALAVR